MQMEFLSFLFCFSGPKMESGIWVACWDLIEWPLLCGDNRTLVRFWRLDCFVNNIIWTPKRGPFFGLQNGAFFLVQFCDFCSCNFARRAVKNGPIPWRLPLFELSSRHVRLDVKC